MNDTWPEKLREARRALGLTQVALAKLVGVSEDAVRKYESGRRRPTRQALDSILDALKLELRERNRILVGAGYSAVATYFPPDTAPNYFFTLEEGGAETERFAWPAFIVNIVMEVVYANAACQRLWGVDLDRELNSPVERNLLSVASDSRFAERVANWDELVSVGIAVIKGHGEGQPEQMSPYFSSVMQRFLAGDPRYIKRFLDQWERTPAREPKSRWDYPVVWQDSDLGTLRFRAIVSTASEPDGLAFNDWIPLDGHTWDALAIVAKRAISPRR